MENFLSAVLGELASRSINFIISRSSKPTVLDVDDSLQRALLRAQVIVDEAMGRHITNQAMLRQLDMLTEAMHRGCYILDTFRYQSHDEDHAKDQIVSHYWSLNSLKRNFYSNRKTQILGQLQDAHDNLSSMILDLNEFAIFLMSYPRLYRQPYSMHLLLNNSMFGRQMDAELIINFLLHTHPPCCEELEVLPIVGPCRVGKSTLVAHVCKDERVCDHFTKIFFLHDHDFTEDGVSAFREGCARKHQNSISNSNKDGRLLAVVELDGDLNEDEWNMLYSSCKWCMPRNSKIIVTSRCDKITKFGTTSALNMKYLPDEAFWYFFKTVTFESMDPKMHPKHVHVAMEIAKMLRCFVGANIHACLLRDNFDIHFWCKVLAFSRAHLQKHVSNFGTHPFELINQNKPVHFGRMARPSEDLVLYCVHQISSQEEVPKIRLQDVGFGSVKALGKLELLGWTSPIPPYYSYVVTCEIQELKTRAAKRKRSTEYGTTLS